MATLNKVMLIGHLGRDPELRYMASGDAVTHMAIATSERWHDKTSGEKKELTEWHRIVLYRKLAEIAGEFLKKGSLVYVEGRLQTRKWTGRDEVERTAVEIVTDDMRMLGARPHDGEHTEEHDGPEEAKEAPATAESRKPGQAAQARYDFEDDAIPF